MKTKEEIFDEQYHIWRGSDNSIKLHMLEAMKTFADQEKAALTEKIEKAIELAVKYGGIDGAHHKDWVIDQMVRAIAGEHYEQIVKDACNGEDGPDTFYWSVGIAP